MADETQEQAGEHSEGEVIIKGPIPRQIDLIAANKHESLLDASAWALSKC